ncbi:MAG: hypothetical protein CEE38_07625 [Planctomycetes bacterium B3_Pla]|nr:MAG: hypothetical protein CEE38_07625 [Planctomycetes bacterium B3_Pla]
MEKKNRKKLRHEGLAANPYLIMPMQRVRGHRRLVVSLARQAWRIRDPAQQRRHFAPRSKRANSRCAII